jgi:hypothetical protein
VRIERSGAAKEFQGRAFPPWIGWAVAVMLLIGFSVCTAADSSSAARPTVPLGSATGMATMWPAESRRSAIGMPASPGSLVTRRPASPRSPETMAVVPRPDHVVVVILENEHRSSVIGSPNAPYLNKLAARGANLTHSYGVTHPSQPNYLALFSGVDPCPDEQRVPAAVSGGRQPGPSAANLWIQLRRLRRVPAQGGLQGMRGGWILAQAQPVGRLRQPAGKRQPAVQRLPARLPQAANSVVREPEHVPQHARLLDPHR